jgi:tetratricopeptide (TPR) repeat protein
MRTFDSDSGERPGAESSWESTIDERLRPLGVRLTTSVRDLDTALTQGFAAASVVLGHRALEAGNLSQAIAAFDNAILALQGRRHVDLASLLAVAHYLRGTAHEAMGHPTEALDDYDKALALAPDHQGAQAARHRLQARRGDAR